MKCRLCNADIEHVFVDLAASPPSNSFLSADGLSEPETYFPLKVMVCHHCWLVQIAESKPAKEIFSSEYVYFSSYSKSWLAHAKRYADMIVPRLGLDGSSFVVEIASNDGYLLRNFVQRKIPCLGVEPAHGTAQAARSLGVETDIEFFGAEYAGTLVRSGRQADLVVGNNVLAHVPDLNDFLGGTELLLKPDGVVTFEFPCLMTLVKEGLFDTIYHEHFSYFSLFVVERAFRDRGLRLFDVERLLTHGGSLRVYGCRDSARWPTSAAVSKVLAEERAAGVAGHAFYEGFQSRANRAKNDFLSFLLEARRDGRKVAGYGAAAKGNTLLNYCGVKADLMPYIVDGSPHKRGLFAPGSHIPVVAPEHLRQDKPDYIVILPWNLREEISSQLAFVREWGARVVIAIPKLEIF